MKDLAPSITRQRLLLEATYTIDVSRQEVSDYLFGLAEKLQLRVYGDPIIHSPGGEGREENQGFDAFIPLIDSGIALYVWSNAKFLSCVLYTCKAFSNEDALAYTKDFFKTEDIVFKAF